jgi:unsaturated rhamnogalacturonyl hydrolase
MKMYFKLSVILIFPFLTGCSCVEKKAKQDSLSKGNSALWSVRMANSVMANYDSLVFYNNSSPRWTYDLAFLGQAIDKLGGFDTTYSQYAKAYIDYFVSEDGTVKGYKYSDFNLDNINPAKYLMTLYKRTGEEKYRIAIDQFYNQLKEQPRTKEGGFWHKKIYPWQMWLDGIYMASPFIAQYAREFNKPELFDLAAFQVKLIYKKTLDPSTGLLYHAWDESREQQWCNKGTGQSKNFWSRAVGWYLMAIIDILDYLPESHPDRTELIRILNNVCSALEKVRDQKTGLWYQVLDQGGREGNYIEGSGSAMYIYVFAKGAKKGYLPHKFLAIAENSFDSFVEVLIMNDKDGLPVLTNICGGCGLGGNPYREGDYNYYINEKKVDNDQKGVAPFILAAIELNK